LSPPAPPVAGIISGTDISVTVPYGTTLTSLTPAITHSGASIDPATNVAQDFSSPVEYIITAADNSTATWTVTVTAALNPAKEITGFSFASPAAEGTVNVEEKTVSVTVPFTDLNGLTPTITHTGASINPASGAAQDFRDPVEYTVTAADNSTETWTVTVTARESLSIDELNAYLSSVSGGVTNDDPVPLPVEFALAANWSSLLSEINTADKYVSLDLSACTMSGTEFDPGTANTGEKYVVSLVLPDEAESVKDGTNINATFQYFTALTEVSGENVETIGTFAFYNCDALTTASFPAATSIGYQAFNSCGGLTTVSFPAAESIDNQAFDFCGGLTTVSFPAAKSIGRLAFRSCTSLSTVNLPAATSIGNDAFLNCGLLSRMYLPAVPPTLGSSPFQNTIYGRLYIVVPSAAAVSAYESGWGVYAITDSGGNPGKYGSDHKAITITDTPPP
jgi:hypothetical protein